MDSIGPYYAAAAVGSRIIEYCGGSNGDASSCTARFLVADGRTTAGLGIPRRDDILPPACLESALLRGLDLFRSVWDSKSILALLDLDYQNADIADEALDNPSQVFDLMEPVYQAVRAELGHFGIPHISVMTGQGYHFAWRLNDEGKVVTGLQDLLRTNATLESKYACEHPFTEMTVPLPKGRAHTGAGVLMEHLSHRILKRAYPDSALPLVMTGLAVGFARYGRRAISIDLSAYADPLFMRYTRCVFSLYRKPDVLRPALVSLPRGAMGLPLMLDMRSRPDLAARCAGDADASIPEGSEGTAGLLDDYLSSDLRKFHLYYESGKHDMPESWPEGYDRFDLDSVPPCVSAPLRYPNPALANPTNMLNVTRVLLSQGWHPRSIAGLVRSKFERDHNWGVNWLYYDAATRADSYVRMFHGMMANHMDDLRDFNCVSHQEKGFCPMPWCGFSLGDYRQPLERALR